MNIQPTLPLHAKQEVWFDELIAQLRTHQLQLETKTAEPYIEELYKTLQSENVDKILKESKKSAQQYFVMKILGRYISSGISQNESLLKLAFDFNDSEVLVWAEIVDDNEEIERELILLAAKLNVEFHEYGFHICSTIVEQEDCLSIPNHYQIFKQ